MERRAYSLLTEKAVTEDADFVYIEGIATTPSVDRVGDVVVPTGARFKTPMPLLLQHDHHQPVGNMTFAKATADGIPFKARLPIIREAGRLKDRVDEAIQSVKYGLITAVSIGFMPVADKVERLKNGGLKFLEWDWHELSLVTIPAQSEAIITAIKSLDAQTRTPATGRKSSSAGVTLEYPGDSGKKNARPGAVKII
jgi:HK97 family phage prohead protease